MGEIEGSKYTWEREQLERTEEGKQERKTRREGRRDRGRDVGREGRRRREETRAEVSQPGEGAALSERELTRRVRLDFQSS